MTSPSLPMAKPSMSAKSNLIVSGNSMSSAPRRFSPTKILEFVKQHARGATDNTRVLAQISSVRHVNVSPLATLLLGISTSHDYYCWCRFMS